MKNQLFSLAIPLIIASFFTWGQNGHRIVAEVCYRNLSPNAKKEVKKILGKELLAEVATWPDFIRSEPEWNFAKPWHFVTINPDSTVQDVIDHRAENPKIENVIEAIDEMIAILKGDKEKAENLKKMAKEKKAKLLNESVEATALAFLVHFIGDVHQPMHVGKNNDRGGNSIKVMFFGEKSNLHSVWDSGIIEQEGLSYTEFSTFINKLSGKEIAQLQNSGVADWAEESVEVREHIYNTLYDETDYNSGLPKFEYLYQHDNLPLVEKRLVDAGVRAAGVLNEIFK